MPSPKKIYTRVSIDIESGSVVEAQSFEYAGPLALCALTRLTDWNAGDVLTDSALEAEFDNIYLNALSLINPLTGNLNAGGFIVTGLGLGTVAVPSLGFTGDTNTGLYSSGAGNVDLTTDSLRGLNVNTATAELRPGNIRGLLVNTLASAVNYANVTPAITAEGPIIEAAGSDTDVDLRLRSQVAGSILLQPGGTDGVAVKRVASAVNRVAISGSVASGSGVIIDAEGSDTDINVNYDTKGAGEHIFKINGTEKARVNFYSRTTSYVVKTADQTATQSNTTLQNITDLVFPVEALKQYLVKGYLHFLGANTTHDLKIGWTYPASCDIKWGPLPTVANADTIVDAYWAPVALNATPPALLEETETLEMGTGAVTNGVLLYAIVTNSVTAGNLQLQFSQQTSSATDLKILKGSTLEIIKLQ